MTNGNTAPSDINSRRDILRSLAKLEAARSRAPSDDLDEPPDLVVPRSVEVSCFIHLEDPARPSMQIGGDAPHGQLCLADLKIQRVKTLSGIAVAERIAYIETGSPLSLPNPTAVTRFSPGPTDRSPATNSVKGDVLIGLIDVGGFDFSHPDFLHNGTTRFHSIWDQGVTDPPTADSTVPFGSVLTHDEMNAAIANAPGIGVAPSDLVRQTAQQDGSHGTHVASIAGGNSGVHPQAILAGVLIALSDDDLSRHATLADSTRLAHAVNHLFDLGQSLDCPIVINISLGTNGHAHDGTSPISRWIDTSLALPGRCVCVAARQRRARRPALRRRPRIPHRTHPLLWTDRGDGPVTRPGLAGRR